MRYYVVFPNGQRFGPADVPTLQLWVAESRVGPATILEEEGSHRTMPAYTLPQLGLQLTQTGQPSSQPYSQPSPQPYSSYYRPDLYPAQQTRGVETTWAWILGVVGLFCCQFVSIGGLILAAVGMSKRQRGSTAALVFCAITFVIHMLFGFFFTSLFNL